MRQGIATVAAIGVLAAVPAVAFADSSTYKGEGVGDPEATIELKITNGDERRVKKVIAKGIAYDVAGGCSGSGRTPKATLRGNFKVNENSGKFRAVGGAETNDPLTDGELKVVGYAGRNRVMGRMQFTFGKDGCKSEPALYKALRLATPARSVRGR